MIIAFSRSSQREKVPDRADEGRLLQSQTINPDTVNYGDSTFNYLSPLPAKRRREGGRACSLPQSAFTQAFDSEV